MTLVYLTFDDFDNLTKKEKSDILKSLLKQNKISEYKEENIYLKENHNNIPYYFIHHKDVCKNTDDCITNITSIYLKTKGNEIIWNCYCIHVELYIGSIQLNDNTIYNIYEQRIWFKNENPWYKNDLLKQIDIFYNTPFSLQELKQIYNLLVNNFNSNDNLTNEFIKEVNQLKLQTHKTISRASLMNFNEKYVWIVY